MKYIRLHSTSMLRKNTAPSVKENKGTQTVINLLFVMFSFKYISVGVAYKMVSFFVIILNKCVVKKSVLFEPLHTKSLFML